MPATQYLIERKGFDKLFAHFKRINKAMRDEVNAWLKEIAFEQTADIVDAYDSRVHVRSTNPVEIFTPVTEFVRGAAGTKINPAHQERVTWLDEGTGLYGPRRQAILIQAKQAKALHFEWKGQEFFRKSVVIKGIKPRRFIGAGVALFKKSLPARVRELGRRLKLIADRTGWH